MPHKRATRAVRERQKALRPSDLAPKISIDHEPIPKSVSRVLDAGKIRREYREKKRQLHGANDEDEPQRKKRRHDATNMKDEVETNVLKIKPGETVTQFNRRVENTMMPLIKTALRQSSAQTRKMRKEEAVEETPKQSKTGYSKGRRSSPESSKQGSDPLPITPLPSDEPSVTPRNVTKEFQAFSTSAPRRLNDVAQEPPDIKKLPRGAKKNDPASGVLSMAQKVMMEEEREKAIKRYRELKARKLREANGVKVDS